MPQKQWHKFKRQDETILDTAGKAKKPAPEPLYSGRQCQDKLRKDNCFPAARSYKEVDSVAIETVSQKRKHVVGNIVRYLKFPVVFINVVKPKFEPTLPVIESNSTSYKRRHI